MSDPVKDFADVTEYSSDILTIVNRFTEHVVHVEQLAKW